MNYLATQYHLPKLSDLLEEDGKVSRDRLITGAKYSIDKLERIIRTLDKGVDLHTQVRVIRLESEIDYIKWFYDIK